MARKDPQVDRGFAEWLRTAFDSPVVKALKDAADELHAEAVALAPMSAVGSRGAPPGYLKSRVAESDIKHSDDGSLTVFVGVPLRDGSRFPLPFISNDSGVTFNRGHKSARHADDDFLGEALDLVASFDFYGDA